MFNKINIIKMNSIVKNQFCVGSSKQNLAFNNNLLIYGFVYKISLYNYKLIWKSLIYFYKFFAYAIAKRNHIMVVCYDNVVCNSIFKEKLLNDNQFFLVHNYPVKGVLTNLPSLKLKKKEFNKLHKNYSKFLIKRGIHPDLILSFESDYYIYKEALLMKIPIISLIDTNNNLFNFLYKIYMNNQSRNSLLFFVKLLKNSALKGIWYEQTLFFKILFNQLSKKINHV